MPPLGGYAGKILRVDLGDETIETEVLKDDVLRTYIGGSSLCARILYDELDPSIGPLDPGNMLIFMTGPLTGTTCPSCGRYCVCTRSPLTGIWAEAHSAGYWGPELKFAGFDGIIVVGKANAPVWLWIKDGKCELRDASTVWGMDTYKTEDCLKKELDDQKAKVACIGPAGERLVRISSIMNDKGRAAGRCGVGAAMGSKKLKAIVVRGTRINVFPAAKEAQLREFLRKIYVTIRSHPTVQIYASYGTDGIMGMMHEYGDVPIKYFTKGEWEGGANNLCGEAMAKTILEKQYSCYRCIIACGREIKIKEGKYAGLEGAGPEYETAAAFGLLCMNSDLQSVAKANDLCNRYGLDTISTGNVIAFAMECYEKGLISKEDIGFELKWGDADAIVEMVRQIGEREGIGALLGEGVKRLSERIDKGAQDFAVHVKGLEVPMHDPRAFKGMGLQYATSHRGACHLRGMFYHIEQGERVPDLGIHKRYERFTVEDKPQPVIAMQNWHDVLDSLIMCKFAILPPASVVAMLSMVTGYDYKLQEAIKAGERAYNLKRLINIRYGIGRKDDTLPKRMLSEPLPDGGCSGMVVELDKMLPEYYRLRGWDENGVPTPQKLIELGLQQ
uniref:Aldehyde ferredoxin oxidoreductase n=1 Tax=Candidatus Methanomethylicus mesodigestus TaxID=1867258 RepID=A0A7C3J2M4_9CREN